VESRLDRAQREGEDLRDWSRWWQRRGREQLELILWAAWDPIGQGVPRDEYSGQALLLAKELRRGRAVDQIAEWLNRNALAATDPETDREVAAKVVDWYASEMDRRQRLGTRG
jgi:hypothetical protein